MKSTGKSVTNKSKAKPRVERRKKWFRDNSKVKSKSEKLVQEVLEDLSEEDMASDDDLSINDDDLPIPPDTSSSEEEDDDDDQEENNSGSENDDSDSEVEIPLPDGSVSGDDSETEKTEVTTIDDEVKKDRERRTIFVGNLPLSVKKMKLIKWFSKYGKVECARLRCPPVANPGKPKKVSVLKKEFHESRTNIHAFVRFVDYESSVKALAADGVAFCENYHLRVDRTDKKSEIDNKKAIFIGNLPFGAEEDSLRKHFLDCGDISSVRIVRDKKTCVGKGFGYVNFTNSHSVRLALEKNGQLFGKRELRVQKANYEDDKSDEQQKKSGKRIRDKGKKKSQFQGELGKKKEKRRNKKKTKLAEKREKLKQIFKIAE